MKRVLVFGGRGFVGKEVCKALAKAKLSVFTFDRRPGDTKHISGDITNLSDVTRAVSVSQADVIVNLTGLSPVINYAAADYFNVHVGGVSHIITASKKHKVKRIVHLSALGADKKGETVYLQTKGAGEAVYSKTRIPHTILRPSVIFGEDSELVKMVKKTAWLRAFPNVPAQVQPVYVKDLATLVSLAALGKVKEKKLDVVGPDRMTLFAMMKGLYGALGFSCIAIPLWLVVPFMKLLSLFPNKRIGPDQIKSFFLTNISQSDKVYKYLDFKSYAHWVTSYGVQR